MTGSTRPPDDPVWRRALFKGGHLPHTSPAEEVRWGLDLPRTLLPAPDGLDQPAVFEPALLQHAYAYRAGDPRFAPWTTPGTAGGTVQLDVVYGELLAAPAVPTALRPLGDGPAVRLPAVTPELSLAWKVMWLINDMHPQGKDLYDAVLLADRGVPAYEVLRGAFVLAGDELLRPGGRWWLEEIASYADVGWEHFQHEYPNVTETAEEYVARLSAALEPVVDQAERDGDAPSYDRWARWLTPLVEQVRDRAPTDPATAVGHLATAGLHGMRAAVVVVREVLGRDSVSLEEALGAVVAGDERWSHWRSNPELTPVVLEDLT